MTGPAGPADRGLPEPMGRVLGAGGPPQPAGGPAPPPVPWQPNVAPAMAAAVAGLAVVTLLGWLLDQPVLRGVVPGLVAMNPLTALAFLSAAAALWCVRAPGGARVRIGRLLGTAVAGVGLLKVVEYAAGLPIGLDQILFRDTLDRMLPPNRMAPNTALCFALGGASLALTGVRLRRGVQPAVLLIIPVGLVALLAVVGYAYNSSSLIQVAGSIPMALNTAAGFLLLSAGVVTLRPDQGPLGVALSDTRAGSFARLMLAAAVLLPVALGWLRLIGQNLGYYDLPFGTALLAVVNALLFGALVLWSSAAAYRAEEARARAHAAVRESERQLFQILETIPVGVFVVDAQGRPYYANRRSADILGKGADPGTAPEELPEAYQTFRAGTDTPYPAADLPVARALRGETVHVEDIEIRRPDRTVPLEVWASPVLDRDGQVAFAIAAFNDVTERRRIERQVAELTRALARQVEELEAVNRELEAFSYSVSHDLRAPLRAVDGFSRILLEEHGPRLEPEARRLLGVVRDGALRMGRLIDDLLRLARLSRKELEIAPVNMDALAREVAQEALEAAAAPVEIGIQPLPMVPGDAGLLRQVWANLIGNAVKYSATQAAPRVEITGERDGAECRYTVKDNGVGFDMQYADKLFAVFHRLHPKEAFEGTGIGLAIVQRVVHRHGGRVRAEAAPGQGATFVFTLPNERTVGS